MGKIQKVLLFTSIKTSCLQFMARDMAHGFRRLGLDVLEMKEFYPTHPYTDFHLMQAFNWFRPELVFRMDFLRGNDREGIWAGDPANGWSGDHVHASWIQDALPHLFGLEDDGSPKAAALLPDFGPRDVAFTSFPGLREKMIGLGFPAQRVHHLAVGANFDLFRPAPRPAGPFTVGFPCNVGHPATSRDPNRLLRRTTPVKWLLELGVPVRLWGEGWKDDALFGPHWQRNLRNGPELREAYTSCGAVLHANSDTNLHQRVFEAVACGRPVLMYALPNDEGPDGILSCGLPGIYRFSTKDELARAIAAARGAADTGGSDREAARALHDYPHRAQAVLEACEALL